ncbi:MAG: hypothetical protein MUD08_02670, partial [Cytophagales bacterium]|nr:hypothetical protein [Cytophagales bacterium]
MFAAWQTCRERPLRFGQFLPKTPVVLFFPHSALRVPDACPNAEPKTLSVKFGFFSQLAVHFPRVSLPNASVVSLCP